MIFNSYAFLVFFPIVVLMYFAIIPKWRWLWLLLASCCFYMAFIPVYILVLFWLIVIDYTAALFIEKAKGKQRKVFLIVSIISTCAVLFIFKYFDFLNSSVAGIAHYFGWNYPIHNLSWILPLGLSFHTFQSLGYVIDVYRGKQKAERHIGIYALYVMFFPQLVAGPIERAGHLLPQFFIKHAFDAERVSRGLQLMLWGMFQKVVIADRLAILVNQVYANPMEYGGLSLVIATVFFAFQIYCDFAGYSNIAIGAAEVMGFQLMRNFARPYLANSIADFWQRWHISLSTWFRDYIYISLGGNRVNPLRWRWNILVTFLLSGIWHGANWTFLVWGGLHGFYYLFSEASRSLREKMVKKIGLLRYPGVHRCIQITTTFALVCFAWIFFRSNNLSDAGYIISHLFSDWNRSLNFGTEGADILGLSILEFIFAVGLIVFLMIMDVVEQKESFRTVIARMPAAIRWGIYTAFVLVIMNFGVPIMIPFIYFQF